MQMPDVNVLISAHRADDPAQGFCRHWVERLATGPEPFALSLEVAVAFVRIVTPSAPSAFVLIRVLSWATSALPGGVGP